MSGDQSREVNLNLKDCHAMVGCEPSSGRATADVPCLEDHAALTSV